MATNKDGCFDWDDVIEDDGQEFIILPEGDYVFTVTDFERGRFPGSNKIPACNKATLTLTVETDKGTVITKTDLILHKSLEWKMSSFFRCIGQKEHGKRLVMDWGKVVGTMGYAHFKPRTYINKDGDERQANDVAKYYDYDAKNFKDAKPAAVKKPDDDGWMNDWMKVPDGDAELPFD